MPLTFTFDDLLTRRRASSGDPSTCDLGVTTIGQASSVSQNDDPVPSELHLNLEEAFRVLEALEDARLAMEEAGVALGLQDEVATVIRLVHDRLGLDEGGVR